MKKSILLHTALLAIVVPLITNASSLSVTSPFKNAIYYYGDTLTVEWSHNGDNVSMIELVPAKQKTREIYKGVTLFNEEEAVSTGNSLEYQLSENRLIPAGYYKIKVTTASNQIAYGPTFTINTKPGEKITPIKKAKYTIDKLLNFKNTYKVGETLKFSFKALENSKNTATSLNGFNIQTALIDPKNKEANVIKSTNAVYDKEKDMWNVELKVPNKPKEYALEVTLYCANMSLSSYCAKTYGGNQSLQKTLNVKVKK